MSFQTMTAPPPTSAGPTLKASTIVEPRDNAAEDASVIVR